METVILNNAAWEPFPPYQHGQLLLHPQLLLLAGIAEAIMPLVCSQQGEVRIGAGITWLTRGTSPSDDDDDNEANMMPPNEFIA